MKTYCSKSELLEILPAKMVVISLRDWEARKKGEHDLKIEVKPNPYLGTSSPGGLVCFHPQKGFLKSIELLPDRDMFGVASKMQLGWTLDLAEALCITSDSVRWLNNYFGKGRLSSIPIYTYQGEYPAAQAVELLIATQEVQAVGV